MNQHTIQLSPDLYDAVRRRAAAQQKSPDSLVSEWVTEQLDSTEADEAKIAFEQEIAAFEQMKPALLEQYAGQFVAIYQGQVVAVGDNRLALVKEVYNQFGEVPCYVEQVTAEPPRRVRITSVWKAR
ncbi:MAG: hypothetical protein KF770_08315 [Anaerolineae bacterium]|nr:hypothetical protein [Anaerolineae bacterium]